MNSVQVEENGVVYELDLQMKSARVVCSHDTSGNVTIPIAIRYYLDKFYVTSISSESFKLVSNIKSITFPKKSKILSFQSNLFYMSTIQKIFIPESLEDLQDGWCEGTPFLTQIEISPKNKNFIFYNNQLILSKSKPSQIEYDILLFAPRNVETINIPSFIKNIKSYCFQFCEKMTSIIFSDDSLLSIIEKFAFEKSSIDSIIIPKSVSVIAECAFASCKNLRSVNFLGNIKNISMNKSSFQNSPFEKEFNKLDFF